MFKMAFKLFLLWRRNDAGSIVFKMLVFAGFAWLLVTPFADGNAAAIGAAAAALVALIKYGLQARRENARLLEMVGGDREKLAALKQKFAGDKAAGGLMMEMLRAEMAEGDDVDEEPELDDAQREANRERSQTNLDGLLAAVDEIGLEIPERQERIDGLNEMVTDGDYVVSTKEMLSTLFEERALGFGFEDFCNDDDHASLVEEMAQATQGSWAPEQVTSSFDEEADRWVVTFRDAGKAVTWRFGQNGDHLSTNFVDKLVEYAQARSGNVLVEVDSEDYYEGVMLPSALASKLADASA